MLVPPRDADRLAEAMERFICEPGMTKRMGERALQLARDRYDVNKVNQVILDTLQTSGGLA